MSKTLKVTTLALMLVSLAAIGVADSHEEPDILVWINQVKAQPGQGDALVGLLMKDAAVLDPLVESGAALEWGIAMPVVHSGGDTGVRYQWITFAGWDGTDQFMTAFNANMQSMSEEERKAMGEEWESIVLHGSHMDQIDRSVHVGTQNLTRPTYIHLSYWSALPGKGSDAMSFYKDNVAPIYDQLVADAKVQNYGMHVPAVHHGEEWTHMSWFMSSNLAARDDVSGALEAAAAARTEEEETAWEATTEIFEPGHEDQILMVVHHKGSG